MASTLEMRVIEPNIGSNGALCQTPLEEPPLGPLLLHLGVMMKSHNISSRDVRQAHSP